MLEVEKYERIWNHPQYRVVAPGEDLVLKFWSVASPKEGDTLIDFGCGTGRAAQKLQDFGLKVTAVDFTENSRDKDVNVPFVQADLTASVLIAAQYGFCTDVLEHIPTRDVRQALINILGAARHAFFQISCVEDQLGKLIGEPLHLTVYPHDWWKQQLEDLGCKILWSEDLGHTCLFYVSAWGSCKEFTEHGEINVPSDDIESNVRKNMDSGYPRTELHEEQDIEIMLIAGGPSLNDFKDEIKANRANGMPMVTTNGSYQWALDNGMTPSAQVILDAREFNKRFVEPVIDNCKYLVASQCHPSILPTLPKDRAFIWHAGIGDTHKNILDEYGDWVGTPGGSTVTLRSIALLRQLGFKKIHIYGFDSCLRESEHHAYSQPENNMKSVVPVEVGGKTFMCHPWMASQAQEFIDMTRMLGDSVELAVYGDGLISHIIKTGAQGVS
jgi:SAM-dependent methyltransferase